MDNEKKLARQHREKQFRRRLTTLSWAVPVFAFGGFFSVWHSISSAVNPPVKSTASVSASNNHTKPTTTTGKTSTTTTNTTAAILFKSGTRNPQVRTIQEQLYQLGYFNHVITDYYGPVTSQAVRSFQTAQHLNPTGEIDNTTLVTLQQAAKNYQMNHLTDSSRTVSSDNATVKTSNASIQHAASTSSSNTEKRTQVIPAKPATAPAPAPITRSASVSSQSSPQTSSSAS